ncbi:Imidazole glycerol phosphate synthase amidotransferase subunit [methanotrophic endosymbiont of Bathymodiolus puteoserpentis (Logatchev)]|nr:Imidazole glycerol phosphate synthase amidotransferase subunit [methanotrophic endosymbiont of Bathymodiolus puteoserpentis (Logatchev)]
MGNLHSIAKALQHAAPDVDVRVVSDLKSILSADRVVFPGVGAMRDCMHALQETELNQVIAQVAQTRPLLGICLGMQALLTNSEENGGVECLNILPGQVKHFPEDLRAANGERLKIPHMGWNQVEQHAHPLWKGVPQNSRFYFVHSYYAQPDSSVIVAGTTEYPENFACALAKDNIFAVQFHPEKSQTAGLQLLNNFLHWDG